MRISGPVLTLAAVGLLAAGVTTTNVVLTAAPEPAAGQVAPAAAAAPASPVAGPPQALPAPVAPAVPAGKQVYSGRSSDGAVTVELWVQDGRAKAYVCDDVTVESWTRGPATAGGPSRLGNDAGDRVEYEVRDGTATGTAWAAGESWDFTAPAVRGAEPSTADDDGGGDR